MFKALDTVSRVDVVILDVPREHFPNLREKGRDGRLQCPTCHQPVGVRTPQHKRAHFFHKHLGDCPSGHDSPELLEARAALYHWLQARFPGQVTIEKQLETEGLPRPVDCWVTDGDARQFAYWIFDRGMKPDRRAALREALSKSASAVHFLFFASRMQRNDAPKDRLNLTTTEREFLLSSPYDAMYRGRLGGGGGSLHYIDGGKQVLTTFRALWCIEDPQLFEGIEVSTGLTEVAARPTSGDFVHPGENDRLLRFEEAERRRVAEEEARRQKAIEAERRREADEQSRRQRYAEVEERRREQMRQQEAARQAHPVYAPRPAAPWRPTVAGRPAGAAVFPSASSPPRASVTEQEGICVACGTRTADWWSFDGKTGQCKCNPCLRSGRFG